MKGIVLAGGSGTRLSPTTGSISKQLLPVFNKPMIYYPLSVLMLADIRDILIITTPEDEVLFERLLGNGEQFGVKLSYMPQQEPNGLAEAFILGESFISQDDVCLVLGDNIFWGRDFTKSLQRAKKNVDDGFATLFGYQVSNPSQFGILEVDGSNKIISIEEKPTKPKSNIAATGLYFYNRSVVGEAKMISPSTRGELEITDLNNRYLKKNQLMVELLGRGFSWIDTGTPDALLEASNFVRSVEKHQGYMIACLEEISLRKGWVAPQKMTAYLKHKPKNPYYQYISEIIQIS